MSGSSQALDLFTLWRQPELPLRLEVGAWTDYRTSVVESGQRTERQVRIQCVAQRGGTWQVEFIPLEERASGLVPAPGEGCLLYLAERVRERSGGLADLVQRVIRWQDGERSELTPAQWREDPLVSASLRGHFRPQRVRAAGESVRVVARRELTCRQWEMSAADTLKVRLPRGTLQQIATREVTAAVHPDVPFLGIVFATERTASSARLEPPRHGGSTPAPTLRIEYMELVGYGVGAARALGDR